MAPQTPLDFLHQRLGQVQLLKGRFENLDGTLGLLLITPKALVGFLAALSGGGLSFLITFGSSHGVGLQRVVVPPRIWRPP
jgi:hypothetical protein